MKFEFIKKNRERFRLHVLCKTLSVSKSGFFNWLHRTDSRQRLDNIELLEEIKSIFDEHRGRYGSPRIHEELISRQFKVSRKRVERLMRENGLLAHVPRPYRVTTISDHDRGYAPNILERNFHMEGSNLAWVSDITYIWTDEGWLYLAVLLDLHSRRVVGWAIADHMRDELTLEALNNAFTQRGRGADYSGLIHHSDRGSQYASADYIEALENRGILRSMSKKGDCWDNAAAESFFATLKKELVYREHYRTRSQAIDSIFEYIETYYNRQRRHSNNDFLSPVNYEIAMGNLL